MFWKELFSYKDLNKCSVKGLLSKECLTSTIFKNSDVIEQLKQVQQVEKREKDSVQRFLYWFTPTLSYIQFSPFKMRFSLTQIYHH